MRTIVISALIILAISTTGYMIWSNPSLQKALLQNLQMSKPQLRGEACLKILVPWAQINLPAEAKKTALSASKAVTP